MLYITKPIFLEATIDAENHEKLHEVTDLHMGQSQTNVELGDISGLLNSVGMKFYIQGKEVDIYRSGLLNPYLSLGSPMVKFIGGVEEV